MLVLWTVIVALLILVILVIGAYYCGRWVGYLNCKGWKKYPNAGIKFERIITMISKEGDLSDFLVSVRFRFLTGEGIASAYLLKGDSRAEAITPHRILYENSGQEVVRWVAWSLSRSVNMQIYEMGNLSAEDFPEYNWNVAVHWFVIPMTVSIGHKIAYFLPWIDIPSLISLNDKTIELKLQPGTNSQRKNVPKLADYIYEETAKAGLEPGWIGYSKEKMRFRTPAPQVLRILPTLASQTTHKVVYSLQQVKAPEESTLESG